MVNPVRFGTGLKIKSVEALAMGRPLVTTRAGAAGIEEWAGKAYLLADSPDEFVSVIREIFLSEKLRGEITENALAFAKSYNKTAMDSLNELVENNLKKNGSWKANSLSLPTKEICFLDKKLSQIKISVVICTYNRAALLSEAIKSLIDQSMNRSAYEIIVVDNGSTDNTKEVVKQFDQEKNFRYIFEKKIGVSYARNIGWKTANGEIVAYLDDDAIACKKWLEFILGAFSTKPNLGAVGGRVEPIWETDPPEWINDYLMRSLSVVDWSQQPIMLENPKYLVCTNIAIPKRILEQVSGFSGYLGRRGESLLSNEEIELVIKIKNLKYDIYYDPAISVKHFVFASRLNFKWFRKRWFMQGVSNAIMYRKLENPSTGERLLNSIKRLINISIRSYCFIGLLLPSIFPMLASTLHDSISGVGFIYGLFKKNAY